jgi:hypothetical protein
VEEATYLAIYGTTDLPPQTRRETAGPLAMALAGGVIRGISWGGTEVVRGIVSLVRDSDWGTLAAERAAERFDRGADGFDYEYRCELAGGALDSVLRLHAHAAGQVVIEAEITAHREYLTNRAGLTLLHPIAGVAGAPLTVVRPDGTRLETRFPERIAPAQPATDIAGLVHEIDGIRVEIGFAGETFEMEDQRNWSDASFKTYCRSLFAPHPDRIAAGETVRQRIEIKLSGTPAPVAKAGDAAILRLGDETGQVPTPRLAAQHDWLPDEPLAEARALEPLALTLRLDARQPEQVAVALRRARVLADADCDLEIVLADEGDTGTVLAEIAAATRAAGIRPRHVLALPAAYLTSYQPSGPWPRGTSPEAAITGTRIAFPTASVGGGMLTNFTELNRRPPATAIDFVTHGSTATVHAADDASVIETLEALPRIFASAAALAPGVAYRPGLISIGARSNPYGAGVAPNPLQRRVPLAEADPRQRGLFAAAWAVGVLAATRGSAVESLCLAAPIGPFGVIYRKAAWPQPLFDEDPEAKVFPLFHVWRAARALGGLPRRAVGPLPAPLVAMAARTHTGTSLIVANPGGAARQLTLPARGRVRLLDTSRFAEAVRDSFWLDTAAAMETETVDLESFAIGFIDLPEGGA